LPYLDKIKRKKIYRIRYSLNGKRQKAVYLPKGTPPLKAETILNQFKIAVANYRLGEPFVNPLIKKSSAYTISEFRDWFFENKKSVSNRTLKDYERTFKILLDATGDVFINNISLPKFEDSISHLAPATRSIIIRSLRAAFSFGIKREIIKENPFLKIKVPRKRRLPDILTKEEKNRIEKYITSKNALRGWYLGRYGALRRDEIVRNIRKKDLWFKQGIINIPKAKSVEYQKRPLYPILEEKLKPLIQDLDDDDYLVDIEPDSLTKAIRRARKKAGIEKRGSVYILRHSFGTTMRLEGVDIKDIKDALGHSSLSTTELYTQLAIQQVVEKTKSIEKNL